MVFHQTLLECADNSGALIVKCLKILGKSQKARGNPGDFAIVSIKTCKPNKKVKKGEVYTGIITKVNYKIIRNGNIVVQCTQNGIVLLNKRGLLLGTRILKPVMREMRYKGHYNILSLAPFVI